MASTDWTTTDLVVSPAQSPVDGVATNVFSPALVAQTFVWYTGGSMVTYVMRARTISGTPPYVYWNSINYVDSTGVYSGHLPTSDLADVVVLARIVQ